MEISCLSGNASSVSPTSQILTNVLRQSMDQSTDIAEKLIKMNVQNVIDVNQLAHMGNIVDTYA